MKALPFTTHSDCVLFEADASVYSADAVLRAAYKLTDRCFVFVFPGEQSQGKLIAALYPKDTGEDLAAIAGQFSNELIDQQIREELNREHGHIRAAIVAQAFAEGNLLANG